VGKANKWADWSHKWVGKANKSPGWPHEWTNSDKVCNSIDAAIDRSVQLEIVATERRACQTEAITVIDAANVDMKLVSSLVRIFTCNGLTRPFPPRYNRFGSPPPYYNF
jgi:hypothetical protein